MSIHDNSRSTYHQIKASLPKARRRVYECIARFNAAGVAPTDQRILEQMRDENPDLQYWGINNITPRVLELIQCNAIREHETIIDRGTNKPRRTLWITSDIADVNQTNLFEDNN